MKKHNDQNWYKYLVWDSHVALLLGNTSDRANITDLGRGLTLDDGEVGLWLHNLKKWNKTWIWIILEIPRSPKICSFCTTKNCRSENLPSKKSPDLQIRCRPMHYYLPWCSWIDRFHALCHFKAMLPKISKFHILPILVRQILVPAFPGSTQQLILILFIEATVILFWAKYPGKLSGCKNISWSIVVARRATQNQNLRFHMLGRHL